ncbi:DUF2283 domain-containing protein [Candidatus Pacearchaeota archaeon]|nr:DUF2283 domain-containing protein [Candidatus Pacearchaeota archaeon]
MEEWYGKEEDILNIELTTGRDYWKSIELPNGIVIDIGEDGKIKGIEILRASKVFSGDVKSVLESVSR